MLDNQTKSGRQDVLGASVPRLEDAALVTGSGRFVGDISFPHQLHMRIVRSPRAHGRILAIDTAAGYQDLGGLFADKGWIDGWPFLATPRGGTPRSDTVDGFFATCTLASGACNDGSVYASQAIWHFRLHFP